jgi:hypothetical protein
MPDVLAPGAGRKRAAHDGDALARVAERSGYESEAAFE